MRKHSADFIRARVITKNIIHKDADDIRVQPNHSLKIILYFKDESIYVRLPILSLMGPNHSTIMASYNKI